MLGQALSSSFRLFRLFGIDVHLHSTWFILAGVWFLWLQPHETAVWKAAQFLSIFGIVLLHEFGHALACRSVGGEARYIVLWPLGGVAFVRPPDRPWPVLWSIAAGPLVNVVLIPVLWLAGSLVPPQFAGFVEMVYWINMFILAFNMLPIYPLDGGQIVQSLLWMVVGRTRSLRWVAGFGFVAAAGVGVLALLAQNTWIVLIAAFIGWQAYGGWRAANRMAELERAGYVEVEQ